MRSTALAPVIRLICEANQAVAAFARARETSSQKKTRVLAKRGDQQRRGDPMQRTIFQGTVLSLLLSCWAATTWTSEVDELRERAAAMRKEAAVLAERGHEKEAERLEQGALKLLEAAERQEQSARDGREAEKHPEKHPGIDHELSHLKARLGELLAHERKLRAAKVPEQELAEVREQIAGTEREIHALHEHRLHQGGLPGIPKELHPHMEKIEAATRRIHHLRIAAENLRLAELHDLAQKIMEEAQKMEQEVQQARQQIEAEMNKAHSSAHEPEIVRELRGEIERLRAEVLELRQRANK